MLSRILKATPLQLTSVATRRAIHVSAFRRDIVQDFYFNEIKSFRPRTLTDKDAEGSVVKWVTPSAPKPPTEEVSISDLDTYAKAPVEVESVQASAETGSASDSGDWFPIESCEEVDAHH